MNEKSPGQPSSVFLDVLIYHGCRFISLMSVLRDYLSFAPLVHRVTCRVYPAKIQNIPYLHPLSVRHPNNAKKKRTKKLKCLANPQERAKIHTPKMRFYTSYTCHTLNTIAHSPNERLLEVYD